jgi:hypothetical protein
VDAVFFALTGLALLVLRRRTPATERGPGWLDAAAVAFTVLELLAIAGSLMARNVRMVALTGFAWIAAALLIWLVLFRRGRAAAA